MSTNDPAPSDLVASILGLVGRAFLAPLLEVIMASVAELVSKIDVLRVDALDAANRSITAASDLRQQIADLRAQLEAAQVPQEVMSKLDEIDATVKSIDPLDPTTLPVTPEPTP